MRGQVVHSSMSLSWCVDVVIVIKCNDVNCYDDLKKMVNDMVRDGSLSLKCYVVKLRSGELMVRCPEELNTVADECVFKEEFSSKVFMEFRSLIERVNHLLRSSSF